MSLTDDGHLVEPLHIIENFVLQNRELEKEELWGFALMGRC